MLPLHVSRVSCTQAICNILGLATQTVPQWMYFARSYAIAAAAVCFIVARIPSIRMRLCPQEECQTIDRGVKEVLTPEEELH
jgi:DNA-binding transcriptional regulator YdaS (Cro superfamily)